MLSRVAECMLWMSRHVERAENMARIIDVNFRLMLDAGMLGNAAAAWEPLVDLAPQTRTLFDTHYPARESARKKISTADAVLGFMTFDERNPNSIISALRNARENARAIRESISSEMWEQINSLYLRLTGPEARTAWAANPHGFYRQVEFGSQQFQGTTDSTMTRDDGWRFIQLGKCLERADSATRLLDIKYRLLVSPLGEDSIDAVQWIAVLKSCSAYEAYRRRQRSARIESRGVAEFLLLDPVFPRSVMFCIEAAWDALKAIAGEQSRRNDSAADRCLGLLRAQLEYANIDDVLLDMHGYLDGVQQQINQVGDYIHQLYLYGQLRPSFSNLAAQAAQIITDQ
jgi:uncharacterized alpha-E superfamily protein